MSWFMSTSLQKMQGYYRDAEIFFNKQVKIKNLENNASPNIRICSNILYFTPVPMK